MDNNTFKYLNKNKYKNDPIVFALTESFVQDFSKQIFDRELTNEQLLKIDHAMHCPDIAGTTTLNALSKTLGDILETDYFEFKGFGGIGRDGNQETIQTNEE